MAFFKPKGIFEELFANCKYKLTYFGPHYKANSFYMDVNFGALLDHKKSIRIEFDFKKEKANINIECQKLPMEFNQCVLGRHKRTTNRAVNRDLGRTPYFIDIICSILKYLTRIGMIGDNSMLAQTLETCK